MSASAPEGHVPVRDGLSGEQVSLLADVLSANARASANIHDRVIDNLERDKVEWVKRYNRLFHEVAHILNTTFADERRTDLFFRLAEVVDDQGWYPSAAQDIVVRDFEKKLAEKEDVNAA